MFRVRTTVAAALAAAVVAGGASAAAAIGTSAQGSGGWLRLDLAPGRYAAICFVPGNAPPQAPHAAMGMVVPFSVTR